jgi:tyrosyl-tRNA synthetase
MNLIKELEWRGMIQDIMPGTEEQLNKERTTGYVGFDPTADSLHIGSLVPIILLVHLQKAGHKPIALVGGATGMVGDPTGKSEERNLLSEAVLLHNQKGIRAQLEKFLDFDAAKSNAAEMANNFDWFKNITFLDFIRDAGKHITVNYMMAKDSVKKRLDGENGMSFTEFTYQLIQGYDFYWLYKNKQCKLQMGGSDQWGNIVTGTELIRRKAGGEAFAFTAPLIRKADGGKFGKTESGNIWLDPAKTSPYQFYQFWLNASDHDAEEWIKIFTFLDKPVIEALVAAHKEDPAQRQLQKKLAEEITRWVHGEASLQSALETTKKLFENTAAPVESLSEADLQAIEGIVKADFPAERIKSGVDMITLLTEINVFPSKGEAKKMIQNGGVSINRKKIENMQATVESSMLLHGRFLLVQKGKRNYYLVHIV